MVRKGDRFVMKMYRCDSFGSIAPMLYGYIVDGVYDNGTFLASPDGSGDGKPTVFHETQVYKWVYCQDELGQG